MKSGLQADPFAQVETTSYLGQDWGLTGLAIDPAFKDDHFVYAFYTQPISPAAPEPRKSLRDTAFADASRAAVASSMAFSPRRDR